VRKIVFKSGRVSTHGRHASSLQDVPSHLTAEHVKKIEEAVQHLDEEELREVMRRLLREMAERGRKRR
jgi:DNA-binding FadR family transcriptional regulator